MALLITVLLVLALASLFGGIFATGLKVLLWVALVLAVVALLSWAIPEIRGRIRR